MNGLSRKNFEELPEFIKKRITEINNHKNNKLEHPLTEPVDIWSLEAERLFPDSPELQKDFNEVKLKELRKKNDH